MDEQEKINFILLDEIETLTDKVIKKLNSLPLSERENRMNYVLEVISRGVRTQEPVMAPIKKESTNLTGFGVLIFLTSLPFWFIFPFMGYFLGGLGGLLILIGLISTLFKA
ncbi:MAG TPA: hypothetical protein VNM22_19520 [Candidatus Limnocylindrales bacterium]|nr:hypothetical protein [Candidatus Limnocylindrales bacterium]